MTKENLATASGQLFANKGKARPASGLHAIYSETGYDEELEVPATPVASSATQQADEIESELPEAASLQPGGFKSAVLDDPEPATTDTAAAKTGETSAEEQVADSLTAGPADIDDALAEAVEPPAEEPSTRTSALWARTGAWHPLLVGAAFAALLLVSLGIGYGISLVAGGGSNDSAEQSVAPSAPTAAPE